MTRKRGIKKEKWEGMHESWAFNRLIEKRTQERLTPCSAEFKYARRKNVSFVQGGSIIEYVSKKSLSRFGGMESNWGGGAKQPRTETTRARERRKEQPLRVKG